MKKMIFALVLCSAISLPAFAFDGDFNCYNKNVLDGHDALHIGFSGKSASLSYSGAVCKMKSISYHPNSDRYEGWVRVGSDNKDCPALGKAIFGDSQTSHKPIGVYWLSISTEVQAGEAGSVQLGYENDGDPGAGAEAKAMLYCYPDKN